MKFLHTRSFWFLATTIILYLTIELSVIRFGIPGPAQIFTYHMDEWHQLMSIRAVFTHFTTTIAGSANSTMFFFLVTGAYLALFHLFGIVHLSSISNALTNLAEQEKVFIILRSSTLLFGVGTMIFLYLISKRYLKSSGLIAVLCLACTPIWITLSNYFKYDVALAFGITVSLYVAMRFLNTPTLKNYIFLSIVSVLTWALKISAPAMFPFVVGSFFLFNQWKHHLHWLVIGIFSFVCTFAMFGVPDFFIGTSDYMKVIRDVVIDGPGRIDVYSYGVAEVQYMITKVIPALFGSGFSIIFYVATAYSIYFLYTHLRKKEEVFPYVAVVCIGLTLFVMSLLPLRLAAAGNRMLVLLPFFALLSSFFCTQIFYTTTKIGRILFVGFILCLLGIQIFEVFAWQSVKLGSDPRKQASAWIETHVARKSAVGIVGVPTYEMVPNTILQSYFEELYGDEQKAAYHYVLVDQKTIPSTPIIILANKEMIPYTQNQEKLEVLRMLNERGYRITTEFFPTLTWYQHLLMRPDPTMMLLLLPIPSSITIYEK